MVKHIPLFNNEVTISVSEKRRKVQLSSEMEQSKNNKKLLVLPGESLTPEAYLQNLIDQLESDIYPLFRQTTGGAPFTVIRNTFCFIDHVSQLLHKPSSPQNVNMKKVIAKLGSIDSYLNNHYKLYAPYLIQLYRHDLVHNIRPFPKSLIILDTNRNERAESWFFNATKVDGRTFSANLADMKKKATRNGRNHLRYIGNQIYIDTFSVYFDTIIFIEEIISELASNPKLRARIVKNYYKIMQYSYSSLVDFKLDIRDNKPVGTV